MKKEAYNPFLPLTEYIPDGEPHVFWDRVYLYSSHDKENGDTFCMLDYVVWSAPINDLTDWTSRGVNYSATQDPLYSETMKYMYAPDCVKGNDGRYYLYYCLAGERGRGGYSNPVSVAVCDSPDGKFTYHGYVRNPDGSPYLKHICFDPAVINDDGVIRLYCGSTLPWLDFVWPKALCYRLIEKTTGLNKERIHGEFQGSFHIVLEDDMLTVKEEGVRIDSSIMGKHYRAHRFFEGSSIRKINGKYYFIYSSLNNHELCYAVSDFPDRGFVYGGTVVSNGDIGYQGRTLGKRLNMTGTNHGSIEEMNGEYYVFYHRLTHQSDYSRQACAEKIEIKSDGSIPQVEITSCGLNGGPLQAEGSYPAVICCNLTNGKMPHGSNTKKERHIPHVTSGNDERYLTYLQKNTLIGYKYFQLDGEYELTLTSRKGEGSFEISVDQKKPLAIVPVHATQAWTDYRTILNAKGVLPLYLKYNGTDADLLQISFRKLTE